jgi:hypothetical protein
MGAPQDFRPSYGSVQHTYYNIVEALLLVLLEAGHQFSIALLAEEGLSRPKKCSENQNVTRIVGRYGYFDVLGVFFWYKLKRYFWCCSKGQLILKANFEVFI